MKIKFKKPKRQRIKKATHKCRPLWLEPETRGLWFNLTKGEWETANDYEGGGRTSSYYSMKYCGLKNVYSLKAAKRLITKWNVPKGTVFYVGLNWVGHSCYITKN